MRAALEKDFIIDLKYLIKEKMSFKFIEQVIKNLKVGHLGDQIKLYMATVDFKNRKENLFEDTKKVFEN